VHWVRPALVAEVAFTGWTNDGRLRHPSFQGLREDKAAREVVREEPASPAAASSKRKSSGTKKRGATAPRSRSKRVARKTAPAPKRTTAAKPDGDPTLAGVRLTNPGRILYPEQGLTKLDLARYYEAIADRMMPHIAKRPLMLLRCPLGREQQCFYQKHVSEKMPEQLGTVEIREDKASGTYLFVRSPAGLIELVQMGVLEMHTWGSTVDRLEQPSRLIFDLDPDPSVSWDRVIDAARRVRAALAELDLESFVKTTGGKGLHVEVPLVPSLEWDDLKTFARSLADSLVEADPEAYVATAAKAKRRGRIFLDYLRNARGATAITAYSTRARAGAPVATPLRWEELTASLRPETLNVATIPHRLARLKADPWRGYFEVRQKITRAMLRSAAR
jgi:bifunctional non-homologous end joining protein LigD